MIQGYYGMASDVLLLSIPTRCRVCSLRKPEVRQAFISRAAAHIGAADLCMPIPRIRSSSKPHHPVRISGNQPVIVNAYPLCSPSSPLDVPELMSNNELTDYLIAGACFTTWRNASRIMSW